MKKNMSIPHYIASTRIGQGFLVLCGLLMASCSQDELHVANDKTDEISFQTTNAQTRGLIQDLAKEGTEICMYGYHNGNVLGGTDKPLEGKKLKYSAENQSWNIVGDSGNPITYYWQGDGTYKFFGWLAKDATGLTVPFSTSFEQNKLKIPETELKKNYNQFDFLYSEVHTRTLPTDGKGAVPVNMKHLFTAFGIGITNTSEDNILVKKVTLRTIHDTGSAVIDFSSTPCSVEYGSTSISRNPNTDPFIEYYNADGYTVYNDESEYPNVKNNIFNPDATAKEYYIVWPQAESVFPKLTFANDEEEAAEPDESFPLILVYVADGQTITKRMQLPKMAWEPGKLYYFDVLVADKLVEIITTVKDWKYFTSNIDFNENTIEVKENKHLTWDPNTCTVEDTEKKVYIKNGQPAEGTFTIDAPIGGQWRASLEGDVTAFEILDDTAPIGDGFGPIDGTQHRIRVRPLINDPDRDYSVRVKFVAVTAGGKTYPADDMLQDVNGDKKADPFTIILESTR